MAAPGSSDAGLTRTQSSMGSPLYMSPEQMTSSKNVDARADIWSMGVVLYELLSGTSPFNGETLPEVCAKILQETPAPLASAEIPAELDAVVQRCLQKAAAARFASMGELAAALVPFANEEGRIAAERIRRLQGGPDASISRPSLPLVSAQTISSPAAVTNASVETAIPAEQPRSRTPLFAALGGVALLLLAGTGLALRGEKNDTPTSTAQPEPTTIASTIQVASTTPEPPTPPVIPVASVSASASASPAGDPPSAKNAGVKTPPVKAKVPPPTTPPTKPPPAGDRRGEDRH
jgi:serine/threonine-protein kinase